MLFMSVMSVFSVQDFTSTLLCISEPAVQNCIFQVFYLFIFYKFHLKHQSGAQLSDKLSKYSPSKSWSFMFLSLV